MRYETFNIIRQKEPMFIDGPIYDMGGGYNPIEQNLVGGREVIVVDYFEGADIVDDLTTLTKIEDNSVANIMCADVIEHTENPWKVIENFHRVLKPDGVMFLTAPFIWHMHGYELTKGDWKSRVDYWRFSPLGLETLCKPYFEILCSDWDIDGEHVRDIPQGPQESPIWRCGVHLVGKKSGKLTGGNTLTMDSSSTWS